MTALRYFVVLFQCIWLILGAPTKQLAFELPVVHLNDFHARYEETSPNSAPCKDTNCIGGFSRVYHVVNSLLANQQNAIFLNAGDNFQGSLWYTVYRWNVTQHFLNKLKTDAYTLGNHEFDHKIEGVVPFIKALHSPMVVANIDDSQEPALQGTYKKSTVIERDGRKIGIIGVIAKNTNVLSSTGKLKFTDEAEAINKEAVNLVHDHGCKIIIVLSHCGLEVDQMIATKLVPHVNLIVGGHSHSLLYNGQPPNDETVAGPYPYVVHRENGRKVLIVQASSYSKYVGNLTVWYTDNGDVLDWAGNPIYLSTEVPQDAEINNELNEWKQEIDKYGNRVLGSADVELSNEDSHSTESILGNFITDAMVDYYADQEEQLGWKYAAIAFVNSGSIRTSISKGNITYNDLITSVPFESTIDVGELTGENIKEILEYSVDDTVTRGSFRQFLQLSGLRVIFDLRKPMGSRVVDLKVKCRICNVPDYEDYSPAERYRVIVNSFLAVGGDGYSMVKEHLQNREIGPVDSELIEGYVKKMSPITQGLDGRIVVIE